MDRVMAFTRDAVKRFEDAFNAYAESYQWDFSNTKFTSFGREVQVSDDTTAAEKQFRATGKAIGIDDARLNTMLHAARKVADDKHRASTGVSYKLSDDSTESVAQVITAKNIQALQAERDELQARLDRLNAARLKAKAQQGPGYKY